MTPAGRWLVWAAFTAITFAALEADALRRSDTPSTLTACTRSLLGLEPRHPRYRIRVGVFYLALAWTAAHISTGRLGLTVWRDGDPVLELGD